MVDAEIGSYHFDQKIAAIGLCQSLTLHSLLIRLADGGSPLHSPWRNTSQCGPGKGLDHSIPTFFLLSNLDRGE